MKKNVGKIVYAETDAQGLDLIAPLWRKLNEHHKAHSPHHARHFAAMTWEIRRKDLLEKSKNGAIRVDLARNKNSGVLVGYCVSTISEKRQGEIESIYIEENDRLSGIGDNLMKKAIRWLDEQSVKKKIIGVASGNEEVFAFYSRYNFYPRVTILEQIVTGKEADSSSF